jgi:hypothetical protein
VGTPLQTEQAEGWGGLLRPNLQARLSIDAQLFLAALFFWQTWLKMDKTSPRQRWFARCSRGSGARCTPTGGPGYASLALSIGSGLGWVAATERSVYLWARRRRPEQPG